MIKRSTWILLAIFIALLGVFFYLRQNPLGTGDEDATSTPAAHLISLASSQITAIELKDDKGGLVSFKLGKDGVWALTQPPSDLTDQTLVQSLLSQLSLMSVQVILEAELQDSSVGLEVPSYMVTLSAADGSRQVVSIGALTSIGSGYYTRVDNEPVVVVSKTTIDNLLKPLTDPSTIATPTPVPPTTQAVETPSGSTPSQGMQTATP